MKNFLKPLKRKALFSDKYMGATLREGIQHTLEEAEANAGWHYTLSDLCDFYFPEGSNPQRQQMEKVLRFCNSVFATTDQLYYLSPTEMLPMINNWSGKRTTSNDFINFFRSNISSLQSGTEAMNISIQMTEGPTMTFYTGDESDLLRSFQGITDTLSMIASGKSDQVDKINSIKLKEVNPEKYYQRSPTKFFKILGNENKITVDSLSGRKTKVFKKTPFLIVETVLTEWNMPAVNIRIAVENDSEESNVNFFSQFRDVFKIQIKSFSSNSSDKILYPSINGPFLQEDNQIGHAELLWRLDEGEPFAFVSKNAEKILRAPIEIGAIYNRLLRANSLFLNIDSEEKMAILRRYIPQYYLELITLTGNLVNLFSNFSSLISEESLVHISQEFDKLEGIYSPQFWKALEISRKVLAKPDILLSSTETLMFELLWREKDIWKDVNAFSLHLTKFVESSPQEFWRFVRKSGLYKAIPAFREIKDLETLERKLDEYKSEISSGIELFCKAFEESIDQMSSFKRNDENILSYWSRVISLLPGITPYRNFRPGKDEVQSTEYDLHMHDARKVYDLAVYSQSMLTNLNLTRFALLGDTKQHDYTYKEAITYDKYLEDINKSTGSKEQELLLDTLGQDIAGNSILDAGCGTGQTSDFLSQLGAEVYGIDKSPGMIQFAREKYPALAEKFLVGDISKLPYEDGSFGIIVCKYVLNENEDIDSVIKEFHRCLKPGGTLIIFAHNPSSQQELSRDSRYALGSDHVLVPLASGLQVPEPLHYIEDYLSNALTDGFIIDRVWGGRDPAQELNADERINEMLFIKAIKR